MTIIAALQGDFRRPLSAGGTFNVIITQTEKGGLENEKTVTRCCSIYHCIDRGI